eukprot:2447757-Pleurochrysis_carterae.AAC.2
MSARDKAEWIRETVAKTSEGIGQRVEGICEGGKLTYRADSRRSGPSLLPRPRRSECSAKASARLASGHHDRYETEDSDLKERTPRSMRASAGTQAPHRDISASWSARGRVRRRRSVSGRASSRRTMQRAARKKPCTRKSTGLMQQKHNQTQGPLDYSQARPYSYDAERICLHKQPARDAMFIASLRWHSNIFSANNKPPQKYETKHCLVCQRRCSLLSKVT